MEHMQCLPYITLRINSIDVFAITGTGVQKICILHMKFHSMMQKLHPKFGNYYGPSFNMCTFLRDTKLNW